MMTWYRKAGLGQGQARVHLKSYSGNRALCMVRTHMRPTPRVNPETGGVREIRLTTNREAVTCINCLRCKI